MINGREFDYHHSAMLNPIIERQFAAHVLLGIVAPFHLLSTALSPMAKTPATPRHSGEKVEYKSNR